MKEKSTTAFKCILLLVSFFLLCACGKKEEEPKVKVLIVPKFEIGEMSGDEAGEAQLFYEHYCAGCFFSSETLNQKTGLVGRICSPMIVL